MDNVIWKWLCAIKLWWDVPGGILELCIYCHRTAWRPRPFDPPDVMYGLVLCVSHGAVSIWERGIFMFSALYMSLAGFQVEAMAWRINICWVTTLEILSWLFLPCRPNDTSKRVRVCCFVDVCCLLHFLAERTTRWRYWYNVFLLTNVLRVLDTKDLC